MSVPVLFLIFNRPEITRQSFEVIREARPERLDIAADGPRSHKEGEDALWQIGALFQKVDWHRKVSTTLFRKHNLGCAMAVSSAITWFFKQESEGIWKTMSCRSQIFFLFARTCFIDTEIHRKLCSSAAITFN